MDLLDKVLLEWSARTDKGYPDLNNEQDLAIFESMFGFSLSEVLDKGYRILKFSELIKRGAPRLVILYDRIEANQPLYTTDGTETLLKFSSEEYAELFKNRDVQGIKDISSNKPNSFPFFINKEGEAITLNDLLKTPEFGGKGAGSGTVVEDENLYILKKKLNDLIAVEGGSIEVEVGGKIYEVSSAETQRGVPKSDFNLLDSKNKPVVFISHKKAGGKGPDAGDFIRWSGYTMYKDHPEVKNFNKELVDFLENNKLDGLPRATRFVSAIDDDELVRKLIYGPQYGEEFSKDNVTIIIQGEVEFEKIGENRYKLTGEHVLLPPSIPSGEYTPYLTAGYRGDRTMFGIENNEAIVMTKAIAFRSSNVYELKKGKFIKVK